MLSTANGGLIDKRHVGARMDTPMIQAVIEMGFSREIVKKVLEDRLNSAGRLWVS